MNRFPQCRKKIRLFDLCFALIFSTVLMFFCSKCSPVYPLNDWPDANVFLSAGKGMIQGKVMYRDLYDHKGPLLFALHALCALVTTKSFFGVWLVEIVLFTLFLYISKQLIALYANDRIAFFSMAPLGFILLVSISFQMGDSAEELALPMMLYPLYRLMVTLRRDEERTTRWQLGVSGFLLGCVFWLKFTLVGIPAGVCLMLAWLGFKRDGLRGALTDIGWMFLGFAAASLPWFIQYILQDALLPMLKTYLYDNLFLYAGAAEPLTFFGQLKAIVKSILSWLRDNLIYTIPLLSGAVWMLLSKRFTLTEKISWALCGFLGTITVFFGGRYYLYYGFAFGAMVPLFFMVLGNHLKDCKASSPIETSPGRLSVVRNILVPVATLLFIVMPLFLSACLSPNQPLNQPEREEMMQYRFARIINQKENPTMLNFEFLDWGFYTAAGVTPHLKYYHLPNMPLDELHSEQTRYVQEGLSDFVVTRRPFREGLGELYTLVDTCPATEGLWFTYVYLYQLTEQVEK